MLDGRAATPFISNLAVSIQSGPPAIWSPLTPYATVMSIRSGAFVATYLCPPGAGRMPPPRPPPSGGLGLRDATSNFSEFGATRGACEHTGEPVQTTLAMRRMDALQVIS